MKIAPETADGIMADRIAGMTITAIAAKRGVGIATVHRYLRTNDIARGEDRPVIDHSHAVADYVSSGDPIRVVSRRHNHVSQQSLRAAIEEAGMLRRGRSKPGETKEKAIADFLAGDPLHVVAEVHSIGVSTLSNWLSAAGVSAKDREELHVAPKVYTGGWVVRGGIKYPAQPVRKRAA